MHQEHGRVLVMKISLINIPFGPLALITAQRPRPDHVKIGSGPSRFRPRSLDTLLAQLAPIPLLDKVFDFEAPTPLEIGCMELHQVANQYCCLRLSVTNIIGSCLQFQVKSSTQ